MLGAENVHLATFGDYVQKFFISALANIKAARTNLQRAAVTETATDTVRVTAADT